MRLDQLHIAASEGATREAIRQDVEDRFLPAFLALPSLRTRDKLFTTLLLVFPEVTDKASAGFIDDVQRELKPVFVEKGLMLGQFHPWCEQGGLHNAQFRPLRAPRSMLVIRHMVDSDTPFLTEPSFMEAYERFYGANGSKPR